MESQKILCTVEILTFNSEKTLKVLLPGLKDFSEIIVLDGGSTDNTREIAKSFGCAVIDQPEYGVKNSKIIDFSVVRNKGLALAHEPWFFFVDSDEIIPPELVEEIRAVLSQGRNSDSIYEIPRKYIIDGVLIENSITYPAVQTRLFRRDAVNGFIKPVHERIKARPDVRKGRLKNAILVPQENIFFPKKWFFYLNIEAKKYKNFSFLKCAIITVRRLAVSALYAWRYVKMLLLRKKNRAPWKFEMSYIAYNFVHIFFMWRARLGF